MPFPQDKYVTVNDLNLHYRDWGGAGQPMVMLHGLASNNQIWDFVIPHLSHGYHVLAVDQRGHGLTNYPGHDYSFTAVTQDLHAFLLALGINHPVLVGHSWGGSAVLHYAAIYPDYVAAIVLVDGGFVDLSQAPGVTWKETRKALAPPDLAGIYKEELVDMARSRNMNLTWSPQMEAVLLASFHQYQDGTVSPKLNRESHMKIVRALWDFRTAELCPSVRCPVLVVPARQSEPRNSFMARVQEVKPASVALLQKNIPGVEAVWMEDTIHDIPLQRPSKLANSILDFLQRKCP